MDEEIECLACHRKFVYKKALQSHKCKPEKITNNTYECVKCVKTFVYKKAHAAHKCIQTPVDKVPLYKSVRIAHSVRAPSSKRGSAKGEGSNPG